MPGEKNFRVRKKFFLNICFGQVKMRYCWQDKTQSEQDMDWIKKLFDIHSRKKRAHVSLMLK